MADDAEGTDEKGGAEESGGLMSKLVPAVGIFVLVLIAQVAAPPITTAVYGPPSCEAMAGADEAGEDGEGGEDGEMVVADLPPALYQPLDPPMVINFEQEDGSTRFLQLSLQAMTRDQATIDNLKTHLPAIRNNFLFLIANREYKSLATVSGKEQLRAELLAEVKTVMKKNTGEEGVEDIYFTSFVMQ